MQIKVKSNAKNSSVKINFTISPISLQHRGPALLSRKRECLFIRKDRSIPTKVVIYSTINTH